jgi:hypothetical protein
MEKTISRKSRKIFKAIREPCCKTFKAKGRERVTINSYQSSSSDPEGMIASNLKKACQASTLMLDEFKGSAQPEYSKEMTNLFLGFLRN